MIERIIHWSIFNRFFVLLVTLVIVGAGIFAFKNTPIDAIPDLSDVQVIINKLPWPSASSGGRSGHLPLNNRNVISARGSHR